MGRFIAGSVSALLLAAAGLFWWQGRASDEPQTVAALPDAPAEAEPPFPVGDPDAVGAPPAVPAATARTREERRFDRYDRDRDNIITRGELLGSRVNAFRKLDADGNNLLSFEEWSVRTSDRFAGADGNGDGRLTRAEFATTAPKRSPQPGCDC